MNQKPTPIAQFLTSNGQFKCFMQCGRGIVYRLHDSVKSKNKRWRNVDTIYSTSSVAVIALSLKLSEHFDEPSNLMNFFCSRIRATERKKVKENAICGRKVVMNLGQDAALVTNGKRFELLNCKSCDAITSHGVKRLRCAINFYWYDVAMVASVKW